MDIIIDTREQKPYSFLGYNVIKKKLVTGDYSISGHENNICIERKTIEDAYGTIGKGRTRFIKELERMKKIKHCSIIIEASLDSFLKYPDEFNRKLEKICRYNKNVDYGTRQMKMNPKSAVNSLIAWYYDYNVKTYFVDNRRYGNVFTLRLLEKYWKREGNE